MAYNPKAAKHQAFRSIKPAIFALTTALMSGTVAAQDDAPDPSDREEISSNVIVVTAQKREQSLQDVSTSIAAFSGDQLKATGLNGTEELDFHVPGLQVSTSGSANTTQFKIRGVGQSSFDEHLELPVILFQDGVYVSHVAAVGDGMYDLERVEVLRGPQGTLYGRNATGGLIHLVSKKPSDVLGVSADLSNGEYNKVSLEAAVNVPLAEGHAVRLSGRYNRHDGYIKNTIGPDNAEDDSLGLRFQYSYEDADFSALVSLRYSGTYNARNYAYQLTKSYLDFDDGLIKNATEEQHQAWCDFVFPKTTPGAPTCMGGGGASADGNPFTTEQNDPSSISRDNFGGTLTLETYLGNLTLTSISDYQSNDKTYVEDGDSTSVSIFNFINSYEMDQISQELRLQDTDGAFRWTAGLYYLNIDGEYNAGVDLTNFFAASTSNDYTYNTESWSVFADAALDLSDNLTLLAGGRWTEDKIDGVAQAGCTSDVNIWGDTNCVTFMGLLGFPGNTSQQTLGLDAELSDGFASFRAQLEWKPTPDVLLYAGVNRGVKSGGFSAGYFMAYTPEEAVFDPEKLTAYEAGWKTTLANGDLRINGSVYYYDYKGFQSYVNQDASSLIFNTDAKIIGAELEMFATPARGLDLMAGLSLLDGEQEEVPNGPFLVQDQDMPNAPNITINAMARYEWDMFGGFVAAQVDYNHVGSRSLNGVEHPAFQEGSYNLFNASITWTSPDDAYSISLWGKNIGDEVYYNTIYDATSFSGSTLRVAGRPQWFGATLSFDY